MAGLQFVKDRDPWRTQFLITVHVEMPTYIAIYEAVGIRQRAQVIIFCELPGKKKINFL